MKTSIFALELCMRNVPGSPLRQALHQLVASHPAMAGRGERATLYSQVADILASSLELADRGCWDYFDDPERAERDFKMWTDGMLTEEGVRQSPSGPVDPYRAEPRYLTFTIALLLLSGSPSDITMRSVCSIDEARLWHKSTFQRVLRGLKFISFASVRSDVMYLIPGDDQWSLTHADLAQPKFEYLRPLVNA